MGNVGIVIDHILYAMAALEANLLRFVNRPGRWLSPSTSRLYGLGLVGLVEHVTKMLESR